MKVHLIDGRILIGAFVCTDKDAHIILSSCYEYFNEKGKILNKKKAIKFFNFKIVCWLCLDLDTRESRLLGLVMIPGRHIISIHTDAQPINEPKPSLNYEQNM